MKLPRIPTRLYHRGKHIRDDGAVSALCFKTPRAINMRSSSWTLQDKAVTCPKCLRLIAERASPASAREMGEGV
jgi:hypothetical protein